jgi:hypothetical protein
MGDSKTPFRLLLALATIACAVLTGLTGTGMGPLIKHISWWDRRSRRLG